MNFSSSVVIRNWSDCTNICRHPSKPLKSCHDDTHKHNRLLVDAVSVAYDMPHGRLSGGSWAAISRYQSYQNFTLQLSTIQSSTACMTSKSPQVSPNAPLTSHAVLLNGPVAVPRLSVTGKTFGERSSGFFADVHQSSSSTSATNSLLDHYQTGRSSMSALP
jgi:hypothetical protein